jgi:hypothetical protein
MRLGIVLVVASALLAVGTVTAMALSQPHRYAVSAQAGTATIPGVLGVLGFLVALALAVIKAWETFFQEARFDAFFDWADSPKGPSLEVSIANIGWKKDSVRAANIRRPFVETDPEEDRKWLEMQIEGPRWKDLPAVLDVNDMTPRMEIPIYWLNGVAPGFADAVMSGTARLVVYNARGDEASFPIPPRGSGPKPPSQEDF